MGNWTKHVCEMKWTDGHIWETVKPIETDAPFFMYKYVLVQDGKTATRENGINRVCDLELLAQQ